MQTLVVANPKGGSGKTTLATNAAGWLAGRKQRVVLADFDPLRAATEWLARRPPLFPAIGGWTPDGAKRELKGEPPQWLVIDTPAELHGESLRDAMRRADILLVPVSPSAFDMGATRHFLDQISEYKAVQRRRARRISRRIRLSARRASAPDAGLRLLRPRWAQRV
ncbi:MAG: ParA family protein [Betaproteobacteria bacterium]|nr:MAG: ParA family protein [Betaproteobacteria bacterium]